MVAYHNNHHNNDVMDNNGQEVHNNYHVHDGDSGNKGDGCRSNDHSPVKSVGDALYRFLYDLDTTNLGQSRGTQIYCALNLIPGILSKKMMMAAAWSFRKGSFLIFVVAVVAVVSSSRLCLGNYSYLDVDHETKYLVTLNYP